jgi:hypothetical protein
LRWGAIWSDGKRAAGKPLSGDEKMRESKSFRESALAFFLSKRGYH